MSIQESTRTRELQLLRDSFEQIQEKEKLLYTEYENAEEKEKKRWDSLFFNSVELFSFFVNKGFIRDRISSFFDDAVTKWYEEILEEHYDEETIQDKDFYPEFKELYNKIKEKKKRKKAFSEDYLANLPVILFYFSFFQIS